MKITRLFSISLAASLLAAPALLHAGDTGQTEGKAVVETVVEVDPFADKLTGDWGGARASLMERGITVNLDATYSFQGVANGGLARGNDTGNVFNGKLGFIFDTDKAGLWPGGFLLARVEGRGGNSALKRAGTTLPVNNQALLPLIPGSLEDGGWGMTELTYIQFLSEQFAVLGGFLNADTGDTNPIAGFMGSNAYFMNTGLLYSTTIGGTLPIASLGGGFMLIPDEANQFRFIAVGSNETSGINPFDNYEGTTFVGEWTTKYELGNLPGGMVFTGAYSIDQERNRLTEDPRVLLQDAVTGDSLTTDKDSWAVIWNGFQYLQGDEEQGWGLFGRFGLADGDPNPVRWNGAVGVGGVGLLPGRGQDRWGLGVYHVNFANGGVLSALGIEKETGGEIFYNVRLAPGAYLTFDAQVVDSAIPAADTVVVLGTRLSILF